MTVTTQTVTMLYRDAIASRSLVALARLKLAPRSHFANLGHALWSWSNLQRMVNAASPLLIWRPLGSNQSGLYETERMGHRRKCGP